MSLSTMPKAKKLEMLALLEAKEALSLDRLALETYQMQYGWQREFVAATAQYHECCLCAGNQVGKSLTGALIDAFHLLGDYPDDWPGHKFESAPLCWGLGYSMEKTRDLLQKKLFGEIENGEFTGGLVPKSRITGYQSATGTPGAARTVKVKHKNGGTSIMQFWSYGQGQHAIMGDKVDFVHVDEEPTDQTIRPQLLTRTIHGDKGGGGRLIYTFTPENGRTELVVQFMDNPSSSQFFMQKGWDDAPHLTEDTKTRLLEQYPIYQRDMRSKGDPILGHGRIYDIAEDFILIDPVEIPGHWYVLDGMDFGWDHPQAHVRIYEDRDSDVIYVAKAWKARHVSASEALGVVKEWRHGVVPTAWPADGLQHEKGRDDAMQQQQVYLKAGFRMLHEHATWPPLPDDKGGHKSGGNSVEQGITEIVQRLRNGKLKIFRGLVPLMDEFRQYHRDEKGKIVKANDDILDALRYAIMMRRLAVKVSDLTVSSRTAYIPRPIPVMGR